MFKLLGKLVKGLLVFVGGLVVLVCCIAVVGTSDSDSDSNSSDVKTEEVVKVETEEVVKAKTDSEKYRVQVTNAYDDGFAYYIEGTLIVDRDVTYAQISIPCYDAEGNRVDVALDNVNNLSAGETWKFKAMCLGDGAVSYDLEKTEVVAY